MPITSRYQFTTDLARGVQVTPLGQLLFTGDKYGDVFRIRVQDGGKDADLTGAAVNAYLMRADHVTVPLTGETDGSVAVVTLDAACYAVPGRAVLAVKLAQGDVLHTIFAGEGAVMRSSTDAVVDPGNVIPSLEELLAQITVMEKATASANTAASNANKAAQDAVDTAQAAANNANGVAQAVQDKLDSGELVGKGLQILGYYDTADALAAGVTNPEAGDAYGVGTAEPYDIYVWDALNSVWVNNGPIQGPQGATGPQGPQGDPGEDGTDGQNGRDGISAQLNLLDNSDFRNPVNQRGQSSYTGSYGIDRWYLDDGSTMTLNSGSVTVDGTLKQRLLNAKQNGVYTLIAGMADGSVSILETHGWDSDASCYYAEITTGEYLWAALYEGEYTEDTLPEYIPKGYAVELMECRRYFYRPTTTDMMVNGVALSTMQARFAIPIPVTMRITPTISFDKVSWLRCNGVTTSTPGISSQDIINRHGQIEVNITFSSAVLTAYHSCAAQLSASGVSLSADL